MAWFPLHIYVVYAICIIEIFGCLLPLLHTGTTFVFSFPSDVTFPLFPFLFYSRRHSSTVGLQAQRYLGGPRWFSAIPPKLKINVAQRPAACTKILKLLRYLRTANMIYLGSLQNCYLGEPTSRLYFCTSDRVPVATRGACGKTFSRNADQFTWPYFT